MTLQTARRRTHSVHGLKHATENAGLGGWRKTQFAQGLVRQAAQRAWYRTHCAHGLALEMETPFGG